MRVERGCQLWGAPGGSRGSLSQLVTKVNKSDISPAPSEPGLMLGPWDWR